MDKLTIITWKWDNGIHDKKGIKFTAHHVNTLYSMLTRHLHMPFEMACITDKAKGIDSDIRIIPLWDDLRWMGGCFLRLKVFSHKADWILSTKRFVSIDLDTVIVNDITPLFNRNDDFIIWGESWRRQVYCGSMWMMDAGARPQVWIKFTPNNYPKNHKDRYPGGTDQKHINNILYPGEKIWTQKDGVYSFTNDIAKYLKPKVYHHRMVKVCGGNGKIPKGARIIFFNGKFDPSQKELQEQYPWIKENWQ